VTPGTRIALSPDARAALEVDPIVKTVFGVEIVNV
jgi:hypothetical protein